ncbi:MAG: 16S rRNA (guanine(527)-N(7))-methyltransferase RsmG [Planctomycetes bacterium]|nr:16S rRNA (guanine(527)-N(7))-methyltransferase RsmG [Planctomycetota bacterium]
MTAIKHIPPDFYSAIAHLGIEFDDGDVAQLANYLDLLLETNKQFNLTAIKEPEDAWTKHILDSLSLISSLTKEGAEHVVDVGSGGGLPGIPLAISMSEVTFTLVETTKKKAMFLSDVVEQLGLNNVTVIAERAENLATKDGGFRDIADAVIARAVGPLNVLLELTVPFAKVGGVVLAIKGERAPIEVEDATKALHILKAEVIESTRTTTGTVLSIRKLESTPSKYPRVAGEPKRLPLGKGQGC